MVAARHSQRPPLGDCPIIPTQGLLLRSGLRATRGVSGARLLRGHFGCARKLTITFLYSLTWRIIMSVIPSNWDAALFEITISNLFHSLILFFKEKKKKTGLKILLIQKRPVSESYKVNYTLSPVDDQGTDHPLCSALKLSTSVPWPPSRCLSVALVVAIAVDRIGKEGRRKRGLDRCVCHPKGDLVTEQSDSVLRDSKS